MKKFIAIALVALAPLSVFGQKFGNINSGEILPLLPDYSAAQTELETLQKQYQEELEYMNTELQKKSEDYEKNRETLPDNIRQRREQELMDGSQKLNEYLQTCRANLDAKENELMSAVITKCQKAIQAVGEEGGYICIFDMAGGAVPFVNTTLTTDVTAAVKEKLGIK